MKIILKNLSEMKNGETKIYDFEDNSFVVVRYQDKFYAFKNQCPHQSRTMGKVEVCSENEIRCEHHGMKFNFITGENTFSSGYMGIPSLKMENFIEENGEFYIEIID